MENRETYPITIAGVERNLPLFEVNPGLRIAILNILGDVELVDACAVELNRLLADTEYDVILTPKPNRSHLPTFFPK
jgi:adenine phosphoribosyltransferase